MNLTASRVKAFVQMPLLGFGDVTTVFCLIPVQAVLLTSQLGIIVGGLPGIDLTVRNAPINAILLIVDPLLSFIDTRMTRI